MTGLLTAIGYQLVALVYAAFSGVVARRGSRSRLSFFFLVATSATTLWAQLFVFANYDIVPDLTVDLAGAIRDGGWLAFSLALLHPLTGRRNYWRAIAALAVALIVLQLFLYSTSLTLGSLAGVSIDIQFVRIMTTILSFILLENILRNAPHADFWALKHWAIGLSAMLVFELIVRIPEFLTHTRNPNFALANPLVVLIALPFFVISSARLPQLHLRIASSRIFIFHTTTLIVVGILLQGTAFAAWYVRSYGGTNGTALALTIAFSGIVGVTGGFVSGTVRSRIRLAINKHLFSLRYDYRVEWEKAIRGLTAGSDENVAARALGIMRDLLDTTGGAIWLYQESWRQFKLSGKFSTSAYVPTLHEADARIELLRRDDRPFVQFSGKGNDDSRFDAFRNFIDHGWIVLPLRYRSMLAGFIVLNQPRALRELDWEDESLVHVLAMQVTAYLVQEETAQSLADARQLEDFNKRFAFVVHDIKNTIGQLSLLVPNIARFGDKKEFRDDMVITLGNSVERLEVLLKSLTAVGTKGAASGGQTQVVDLHNVLEDFVLKKTQLGYNIHLHKTAGDAMVNTDAVAFSRVLEHVVSNAFEASEPAAPVEIHLSLTETVFEVVVADRGAGMTQQFIDEELFRPLRSTKRGGFGVGGYQIRELMRDLGGDVDVESVVGSGTRVILSFLRNSVPVEP
jgi:putative PEP-CTERM system histidine kinase